MQRLNQINNHKTFKLSDAPWSQEVQHLLDDLDVTSEIGLSNQKVADRQAHFGLNQLQKVKPKTLFSILINQLKNIVVVLLFFAGTVSILFGELLQGFAVFTVIFLNTLIGFVTEWRAIRSMEALRQLGQRESIVRRNSQNISISAQDIVPGDIVIFEGGDVISADMRVIDASDLQADESALTGESIPVTKKSLRLSTEVHLAERSNILFKGTAITRGSGEAVVVGIGLNTELGKVANLVSSADSKSTPLEKKLAELARKLVYVTLLITTIIAITGILIGRDFLLAIEIAIALAVAAIPEGLPIVATIALANGMHKMAKRHALINRLSAVETLGATSVILTDKTGTLTENQMTLNCIELEDMSLELSGTGLDINGGVNGVSASISLQEKHAKLDELLKVLVLCNNASLQIQSTGHVDTIGDPTEVALLIAGAKRNIQRDELLKNMPELREISFNSETKAMATVHQQTQGEGYFVAVKGAPESIFAMCNQVQSDGNVIELNQEIKDKWEIKANALAQKGLRILAVAKKNVNDTLENPYKNLILLGIVGLLDPPRSGVKEAISQCHEAGIQVIMVTGDHPQTAYQIGSSLGITVENEEMTTAIDLREFSEDDDLSTHQELLKARIFARATPKQKQELIHLYQNAKHVVAMTGDGINDAPALKSADIGIAMGIRGTQVAKDAADMVLQDDAFSSIVAAIRQGRIIYKNIQKFVIYLLSCNLSEIFIISLATLAGAPLPLLPLQIIFLNLVTDVFPALALGVSSGSSGILQEKPRQMGSDLIQKKHWIIIVAYAAVMSLLVLLSMYIAMTYLAYSTEMAVTVAFLTLAFAQLWHVFNLRDDKQQWLNNEITTNKWVWLALALCSILLLIAVYTPVLSEVLQLIAPDAKGWVLVLMLSFSMVLLGPFIRKILARFIK